MADTLSTWSFSSLMNYESCPFRAKLEKIDKIPAPPRPAPPKGGEHANDRGSRIHDHAELYVKGQYPSMTREMETFEAEFDNMRVRHDMGQTSLEQMWCFNRDWHPVEARSDDVWLRIKLDALVRLSLTTGAVIDYKTGKKYGNEVKHGQQGQLYQLGTFIREPDLSELTVEFWYLDQNEITKTPYSREKGMKFWKTWNDRAVRMTTDTTFEAKPNGYSCKFCPYGPKAFSNKWVNKSGDCPHGVA